MGTNMKMPRPEMTARKVAADETTFQGVVQRARMAKMYAPRRMLM